MTAAEAIRQHVKNETLMRELSEENGRLAKVIADHLHELVNDYQVIDLEESKVTLPDYRNRVRFLMRSKVDSPYLPAAELAQVIEDEDEMRPYVDENASLRIEPDHVVISVTPPWHGGCDIECRVSTKLLCMSKNEFDAHVKHTMLVARTQADIDADKAARETEARERAEWERLKKKFGA